MDSFRKAIENLTKFFAIASRLNGVGSVHFWVKYAPGNLKGDSKHRLRIPFVLICLKKSQSIELSR